MKIVEPTVLFTFQNQQGRNPSEGELLQMFFPSNSLLVKRYYIRTLFVVTHINPFKSIWTRVRKNSAFKALVQMYYSCIEKLDPFTAEVASTLRFFKRNKMMNIENFNNWYPLAHYMTTTNMFQFFNRDPSIVFGRTLFQIMKRSSQHVISPQHPPPDFYTCQTTLSDTDPVGIACRIINSKVEYVSVMILSYTKEWFLDTNNMSCCFVPTERYAMCRYWFPLLKDKTTWENFGLGWYLSNLLENSIHLTSLIDWVSIQSSEPYRHIRNDLMQIYKILVGDTLKKDISRDVTEAFTASKPLVDQYPELYRSSSSFLDFLFKLCHVSNPPSPCYQGENLQKKLDAKERELASKEREWMSFEEKLREKDSFFEKQKRDYEIQIANWREKTLQYEVTIKSLQDNVSHCEAEIRHLNEQLLNSQTELKECLDPSNGTGGLFTHHCSIEEPPRQSALEFSTSGGIETTCQALEYPSQNERVLEEMEEWKQELRSFLDQFKKDMCTNFTLTAEQNEKISKLLETLHPVPPSSEPLPESTVSVDEISTKLFDAFEKLLHRKLSKDHLKHMLKTFQLDEHFDLLESNLSAVMKKSQRQKVLNHVNHTKYRVKEVIESFFQKLSTLFGSDLPSLHLMERLDFLEEKYLAKNTELAKESSKLHEFVRQHFSKIAFSENWQELFINQVISLNDMIASFQESLKTIANRWNFHYIPGLEHEWFETMEKKLQYSHSLEKQLTETNIKLKSIYETMLNNLDDRTKLAALQNPTTIDQQFFDWVNNGVQQLRNELDEARKQLVLAIESPSNYEITEVPDTLPAICGADSELKQERDQLKVERDRLKEKMIN
ncbi:uncharacterized protein TNCV_4342481 [Trichonephila clavipes]|nr:uncharacterized protein TNCV_4342481 [Trichonephila clavipes]